VWTGGREQLDIRDGGAVLRMLEAVRPDVIFNAAAYNAVDLAERAPADALAANAVGPRHLAVGARRVGALLVHVSSDYVFDGRKAQPYVEDDCPRQVNAYGASKLAGESLVAASGGAFLIVRTSAVIGTGGSAGKGGSFVERILQKARSGGPLRVVSDQIFAPTYAPDLAAGLVALVEANARGFYHLTNAGECSWHELAEASVKQAGLDLSVEKIRASDLALPASRPAYSVLSNERYASLSLPRLRHWRETLPELIP
jgi:dTDP-4-dehydrorhamnose reductase